MLQNVLLLQDDGHAESVPGGASVAYGTSVPSHRSTHSTERGRHSLDTDSLLAHSISSIQLFNTKHELVAPLANRLS